MGDVPGAYLTTPLTGPPTYITTEKAVRPANDWRWWQDRQPVAPVHTALYGLPRSGADWGEKARQCLEDELLCERVLDTGEESVYMYRYDENIIDSLVLIVLYVDDFAITGKQVNAELMHNTIMQYLGFGSKPDYELFDFIGIERQVVYKSPTGSRILVHQASYAVVVIEDFEKRFNGGKSLQAIATPMKMKDDKTEVVDSRNVPSLEAVGPEMNGKLLWLSRGTRPDLGTATTRLSRRLTRWSRDVDLMLWRIMKYLRGTTHLGILMEGSSNDLGVVINLLDMDADHGGDIITAKSTSGYFLEIRGPSTQIPIYWGSKSQDCTALSTGDAELTACRDATFRSGLPWAATLEKILRRYIRLVGRTDSNASLDAIRNGYSKKMAYLDKHKRISISSLHEVYIENHDVDHLNLLLKMEGLKLRADVMTKPIDSKRHWELLEKMGMALVS